MTKSRPVLPGAIEPSAVAAAGAVGVGRRRAPSCASTSPAARSSRCRSRSPPLPAAAAKPRPGSDIAGVVSADLERSGLFRPIDPRSFIQNVSATDSSAPRFGDWRQINAQALVTGTVQTQGDGRLGVQFRLWDVFAEQQLAGFGYTTTRQNWRRIAHIIADEIYKRITGEDGYFDTRIVYVAEIGPDAEPDQASGDHGSGRRQQPLSDRRARAGADPAFFADGAGDHLSLLCRQAAAGLSAQHRHRAAGGRSATFPA